MTDLKIMPLLSPNNLRIWRPTVVTDAGRHELKHDAEVTYKLLQDAGWVPYAGPAKIDQRGWIVDTAGDPTVKPKRPDTLDPYDRPPRAR